MAWQVPPRGVLGRTPTPCTGVAPVLELENPAWIAGAARRAQERGHQGRIFVPTYLEDDGDGHTQHGIMPTAGPFEYVPLDARLGNPAVY